MREDSQKNSRFAIVGMGKTYEGYNINNPINVSDITTYERKTI